MDASFFINWQDPATRRWHPVARMTRKDGFYIFAYTEGAKRSPLFLTFGNMTDLESLYVSTDLFPIFANRVMSERRPEYRRYAMWSGLESELSADPLLLMARMGGTRATDTLQVYPVPERSLDGRYRTVFFSHGISHLPEDAQKRTLSLQPGDRLYPLLDLQNPFDEHAVALRSPDPSFLTGYCPRYLARDIAELAKEASNALTILVKQVNSDAPAQFRLLCEAESQWPRFFEPCDDSEHKTIVSFDAAEIVEAVQKPSRDERAVRV